jgi:hypothetical protein
MGLNIFLYPEIDYLDEFPWFNVWKRVDEDLGSDNLVRSNGSIVFQFSILELDHVVDGVADHFAE